MSCTKKYFGFEKRANRHDSFSKFRTKGFPTTIPEAPSFFFVVFGVIFSTALFLVIALKGEKRWISSIISSTVSATDSESTRDMERKDWLWRRSLNPNWGNEAFSQRPTFLSIVPGESFTQNHSKITCSELSAKRSRTGPCPSNLVCFFLKLSLLFPLKIVGKQ